MIKRVKGTYMFYEMQPDFINSFMEIHKGHGPTWIKRLQTISGIGLFLTVITGIFMIFKKSTYRKEFLISFSAGTLLFILGLLL